MKKTHLGILLVSVLMFPTFSHAQVYFGGYDYLSFPMCNCTPVALDGQSAYEAACVMLVALPPTFFFELFAPLWIGSGVPIGGFLAIPIGMPLAFPTYALLPEEWALGSLDLNVEEAVCGFAHPVVCSHGFDIYPAVACFPIELPVYGIIDPLTGAAPGSFGF